MPLGNLRQVLAHHMRRSLLATLLATGVVLSGPFAAPGSAVEPGRTLTPTMFGARGNGVADDTQAVQRSLDALRPGDTLLIEPGRTYRHTDILRVGVPGVRVTGRGTLLATKEGRSEVLVDADRVVLDGGLTLRMGRTTKRWDAFEQMKLRLAGHSGVVVRDVTIHGAAAAGVYVGTGASRFLLEDVRVRGTRADGIHITGAAHDGVVRRATVERSGDDGVAVVSYGNERAPVRRILVEGARVSDNTWGRGVSVVGGEDITYRDLTVRRSNAAAVYVATEGAPYNTYAARRIRVEGGRLVGSNTNRTVDHGAVMVHAGRPGFNPSDVTVTGLTVESTRASAPFQVSIVAAPGADVSRVRFDRVDIRGGGNAFWSNVSDTRYRRTGWVVDGRRMADHR